MTLLAYKLQLGMSAIGAFAAVSAVPETPSFSDIQKLGGWGALCVVLFWMMRTLDSRTREQIAALQTQGQALTALTSAMSSVAEAQAASNITSGAQTEALGKISEAMLRLAIKMENSK